MRRIRMDLMHVLFANTGVQYLCIPLDSSLQYTADEVGSGWQRCRCGEGENIRDIDFIQWRIVRRSQKKLFLAVDTTCGDETDIGYFHKASALSTDVTISLPNLLSLSGKPLAGVAPINFIIRPATAEGGDPKDVHFVVDFGNSRSGGLLLEFRGQEPLMHPFHLINRHKLDAWNSQGELTFKDDEFDDASEASYWFSSKTQWCAAPYLPASKISTTEYRSIKKTRETFFGKREEEIVQEVTVFVEPKTFQDISMVRMGDEADDLAIAMRVDGAVRTSLSSPKRYLWAQDDSWLEGANWHMADPWGRLNPTDHAATLQGPLLAYLPEKYTDADPAPNQEPAPHRPRHAPNTMMVAALYELLSQAYTYINSLAYRKTTGEVARMRTLRSLTLSFPTGMIAPEKELFEVQARKAIKIFRQTLGRQQDVEPDFKFSVDEASAVHLTYIWSEVRKLGQKPGLWFSIMGRRRGGAARLDEEKNGEQAPPTQTGDRPGPNRPTRPSRPGRRKLAAASVGGPELRIACIDIGGGTSDLMIAKYVCDTQVALDCIQGEILHKDGISLAGDHLIKRLLERIIVPAFVEATILDDPETQRLIALHLFGPEVPGNREFRAQRINWMNRLFVPLAQAYLERAVENSDEEISHTNEEIVDSAVWGQLQETLNSLYGSGNYHVQQALGLEYDPELFEDVVHEVFNGLLFDFCESIVEHQADVVLLAGQPTKLQYVQELVKTNLPLPRSRIIPMYQRYAGNWYPYQNPDGLDPGVIVDPKSAVVVGAAIEFAAKHGMLSKFNFSMTDVAGKKSYFWGIMAAGVATINTPNILFECLADDAKPRSEQRTFRVTNRRVVIGRKRRAYEHAQASPIYVIIVDTERRIAEIEIEITIERKPATPNSEETLNMIRVEGVVAGQPAELGRNVRFEWRTLADEQYFLDTGGLDKIELAADY